MTFRAALAVLVVLLLGAAMPADTPKLMTWPDLLERPRPKPDATFSYGPDLLQRVDLWLPAGAGPHPVVLMVHGGCWTSGVADRSIMAWIAADLRASGVAVWNIDYRGVDRPGGGYPGTFQDAARAADLLRENAAHHHLDLTRLVAVGHSAGGHLALWLAGRARLPAASPLRNANPLHIDQVISLGGLPDLEMAAISPDQGCGAEVVAQLTGAPTPGRPDVYADTSVPRLLPIGARQQLIDGAEDSIIPARFGPAYVERARAAGDHAALTVVPNTGHVELIAPESAAWAEAKRMVLAPLLPGTGRGTATRSGVVEGARSRAHRPDRGPLHQPSAAPPLRSGEE